MNRRNFFTKSITAIIAGVCIDPSKIIAEVPAAKIVIIPKVNNSNNPFDLSCDEFDEIDKYLAELNGKEWEPTDRNKENTKIINERITFSKWSKRF